MYSRYLPDLEGVVLNVQNWAKKFNMLVDMKKNRDKAVNDFNKKVIAFEKKQVTKQPTALACAPQTKQPASKLEQDAKMALTFVNSQNKQLLEL